ncbi:RICIN domain-containing protein [Streptomyces sp. NPDC086549]|uniref:RICIN domain-containing protein n=1 Tax=Streptomyces sp. NPDC086549 TaxID=3365752 RepID=UPI00382239DC
MPLRAWGWGRGRRTGVIAAVTALLAVLLAGLGTAGTAQAATVETNAWYVLVNRGSGKALDVSGASTADGAAVQQWTRHGGANQRFQFVDSGGGYYRLKAQHSGKVLDVLNYSGADHADIVQWSDAGGTNQQFRLADSPDGYVRLISRNSGKAVEVENASTADGAKVVQFTDWGGANQQWQLVRATGVLAQVHTAGRVKDAGNTVQYSWPGVYFAGRVGGTGVGIVLNDSAADYDVQVDGTTVATLVRPGNTTHWINGLQNREHTVRLVKRNDTPGDISTFGGFVAAPGGAVLSKPTARNRQMEFIGDSLTVGYGNLSTSRDCTSDQLKRTTDADVSYGALTARQRRPVERTHDRGVSHDRIEFPFGGRAAVVVERGAEAPAPPTPAPGVPERTGQGAVERLPTTSLNRGQRDRIGSNTSSETWDVNEVGAEREKEASGPSEQRRRDKMAQNSLLWRRSPKSGIHGTSSRGSA